MIRLIYKSTATKPFTESDINALLEKARYNNKQRDITGFLIIKGKTFIQAIEGNKNNIEELFCIIKKDQRHKDITIIKKYEIDKRLFTQWDMGYKSFEDITLGENKKLKEFDFDNIKDLPKIFENYVELF